MWSAAILAGGRARRLGGQDKCALIVEGVSILDRQLAALRPLTDTILLVGYPAAAPASCTPVHDLWPGTGPLGGIATALAAATTERMLILAADLPFVTTPFLRFLAHADENALAVVPMTRDLWHPLCAMYHRRSAPLFEAALSRGDYAVRNAVAQLHPTMLDESVLATFDPDDRLLANINTPDDLRRWSVASTGNRTAPTETSQTTNR
jgi:molybdopterin-guanine dinucleotide biosynthesis protein A